MLVKGKLVPNWATADLNGVPHSLWDFRQKSHVILFFLPSSTVPEREGWRASIEKNKKRWEWLNATFLILREPRPDFPAGVYVIDRYGRLWNFYSSEAWDLAVLENDLVYYEARHC
jgi:hypothetical protein